MPLLARKKDPTDVLAGALLAAELGEPTDTARLSADVLRELFESIAELRVAVPYATIKLLSRLASDGRVEVRAQTARALGWFAEIYPDRVEELLLVLSCDASRKVRHAAAESLADLLPVVDDPLQMLEEWQAHPDRARETLQLARRSLPPPLGL